jgi:hypothetical protein
MESAKATTKAATTTPPMPMALPQADVKKPDPLQAPDQFATPALESKPSQIKSTDSNGSEHRSFWQRVGSRFHHDSENKAAVHTEEVIVSPPVSKPIVSPTVPSPADVQKFAVPPAPKTLPPPTIQPVPVNMPPVSQIRPVPQVQPVVQVQPPQMQPVPQVPQGAQSVLAAGGSPGMVHYVPVPIVTLPDMQHGPMPSPAVMPQPPQPVRQEMGSYPMQPNRAPGPNPTTTDPGMENAFTSMPSEEAVARATNAFGTVEAGMGPVPMQRAPGAAPQMMVPHNPYGAPVQGMVQPGHPVQQVGYSPVMEQRAPAMAEMRGQEPSGQAIQQMVIGLRESLYPSQREWAAESLATVDWRKQPVVVQALVAAAKEDPAPTVRASCVRCLAKMHVNAVPVVGVIQGLKSDPDPRVRQEADLALNVLMPGQASGSSGVQPASAVMPIK